MARVTNAVPRHRKKKRYFRAARGYFGGRSKLWRIAKNAVERGWAYSYRDRKQRDPEFRRLCHSRSNEGVRQHDDGLYDSDFMNGPMCPRIEVIREALADLAVHHANAFGEVVCRAKTSLS